MQIKEQKRNQIQLEKIILRLFGFGHQIREILVYKPGFSRLSGGRNNCNLNKPGNGWA
jgi:hypothetical protein